ncbi:hypothetical protein ARMSODRAFT_952628 [Armillaria solidipes]|uniref:Uncharacterized protein n=1 Tax=Armillaria solidipes TaxID=1076256 RepID=A0A2H3BRM1_9AGAR|nr:hypothetical protein ARMSODRAFT_952628 [Armillaria solidipes]
MQLTSSAIKPEEDNSSCKLISRIRTLSSTQFASFMCSTVDALTERFHYTSLTPISKPILQASSTSSAFSSLHSHPPYPNPVQTTNHRYRLLNHVFDNGLRLSTLKDGPKCRKMSKLALCSQSRFKIVAWTTELASSYAYQGIIVTQKNCGNVLILKQPFRTHRLKRTS